jgi:hypothetical protein
MSLVATTVALVLKAHPRRDDAVALTQISGCRDDPSRWCSA